MANIANKKGVKMTQALNMATDSNILDSCNACTLDKCTPNQCYKIYSIKFTSKAIKERLASFGVVSGALCTMLYAAPSKSTLSIQVNQTLIALRQEEAQLICVEPIHH